MEVTKWLKPSISVSQIGDSASVQAATRVNAEQSSKRTMRRSTRQPYRGRLRLYENVHARRMRRIVFSLFLLSTVPTRVVLFLFNVIETNVLRKSSRSEFSHSLGHQETSACIWARSVHPSTADVRGRRHHVRKVPFAADHDSVVHRRGHRDIIEGPFVQLHRNALRLAGARVRLVGAKASSIARRELLVLLASFDVGS